MKGFSKIGWAALALLGAFCLGTVALRRGEHINALWIVVAAVSLYLVAYRFYSLFIADKVMQLDPTRATPAVINNDGLDYVPTNKHVLFATTSPPLPVPAHWSARCWPRRWATCPACCGWWSAWYWPVRCRTSWSCSCPAAATAVHWVTWCARRWARCPAPSHCSVPS
jgi:hypothetical protein